LAADLYDLHTHTTASDGRLRPRELVREAAQHGVRAFAITDHDTVEGVDGAQDEAAKLGVELIPGIEVSASYETTSIHILGLFIRHRESWLVDFFTQARERRIERIHRILEKLARQGVEIEPAEVFAKSTHGTVGRPHIADVLVERGIVASTTEAFDRYLGLRAPAYVGYDKITYRDAIDLIRQAGGVASLAHPGLIEQDDIIPKLVDAGLQALEVFHCEHSPRKIKEYLELTSRHGLLVTGGSDFHADGAGTTLGCPELSERAFDALRRAARP
jgi:predicted metal-dependent phosphoesterase TrpH